MTENQPQAVDQDLTERIRSLRDALTAGLVERGVAVRLALLASVAGEHLLMVGPPGTAKSLVARLLALAFKDATRFEHLLTRFTVPEELFGPLSIKALEQDKYQRQVDGYLPTASIAFLDEVFKANSAILNALLTLLNEREFDNGSVRSRTPLISVVAASNELPESEELDALYDRFLLRLFVGPVSTAGFRRLLLDVPDGPPDVADELRLDADALARIKVSAIGVEVPDDVVALLSELRVFLAEQQIVVSDRRWRKIVRLLQVSAATNGHAAVSIWDCWLLSHCVWNQPEEREVVHEWYASRVGHTEAMDTSRLEIVVSAWEGKLEQMQGERAQAKNPDGRPLFVSLSGNPTVKPKGAAPQERDGEPLYLAPANWRHNRYDDPQTDRTCDGAGVTEGELHDIWVDLGPEQNPCRFNGWRGRDEYLSNRNNLFTRNVGLAPIVEPARYPSSRLVKTRGLVEAQIADVATYAAEVTRRLDELEQIIAGHLWVTDDFLTPARENLQRSLDEARGLEGRLQHVADGISALPVDQHADEFPT